MDRQLDERGVSTVIGAVLIFGMLVVLLSTYQAVVIPSQNKQVEASHYEQVISEFSKLETSFSNAVTTGEEYQTTLQFGTRYPSRIFGVNPPSPYGKIRPSVENDISITGATDPDGDSETIVEDVCGVTRTRTVEYTPVYSELDGTGTLAFENGVRYRVFPDGTTIVDNADGFIDGTTITLRPVTAAPSETSAGTKTYSMKPGTEGGTALASGDTSSNFAIQFPSRLSADTWENEILDGNPNVESVSNPTGDIIRIELDDSKEYTLKCRAVGIDEKPTNEPDVDDLSSGGSGGGGGGSSSSLRSATDQSVDDNQGSTSHEIEFTVDRDLANGETVLVGLADAQDTAQIDYQSASVSSVERNSQATDGSAEFATQTAENAVIEYTAGGSVSAGDTITISLDGVDTDNANTPANAPYDIEHTGPDGDTVVKQLSVVTPTLTINDDATQPQTGSVEFTVSAASSQVTITDISVDSTNNGAVTDIDEHDGGIGEIEITASQNGDAEDKPNNDATGGKGYAIGETITLDTNAKVNANTDATVTISYFDENDKKGVTKSDMSGSTVTVTITYEINGNVKTVTKTLTVP